MALDAERVVELSVDAGSVAELANFDEVLARLAFELEAHAAARYRSDRGSFDGRVVLGVPDLFERWGRFVAEHPDHADPTIELKRRTNLLVGATTALVDRQAFTRSAVYNDFYRREDLEHAAVLRISPYGYADEHAVSLVFMRCGRQPEFSEYELLMLSVLRGTLEEAFGRVTRSSHELPGLAAAAIERIDSRTCALVDLEGRVLWLSSRGSRWFPSRRLPEPLLHRLRRIGATLSGRAACLPKMHVVLQDLDIEILLSRDPRSKEPFAVLRAAFECGEEDAVGRIGRERGLRPREQAVLRALVQGLNNRQIAEAMFISHATVRTHVASVFKRLGVHSRLQAVALVLRAG